MSDQEPSSVDIEQTFCFAFLDKAQFKCDAFPEEYFSLGTTVTLKEPVEITADEFRAAYAQLKKPAEIAPHWGHECVEWDGLYITEFDPEWDSCMCFVRKNLAHPKEHTTPHVAGEAE